MTRKILEAVNKARELFEIEDFPGDFFSLLNKCDYVDKYKILLFKEDIDKLSGFIGYGKNKMAVICINYKRSIGHQNFTLAHEIGHWLLHNGQSISDADDVLGFSSDLIEKDANEFARELLYPEGFLVKDYYCAIQLDLFSSQNRKEFGTYINTLCHKYCLSYKLILQNLLYKHRQGTQYPKVRKEIEKALGGKVSESFDKDFYMPNEDLLPYKQFRKPYEDLGKKVDDLVTQKKISIATGEAIKIRNGVKID